MGHMPSRHANFDLNMETDLLDWGLDFLDMNPDLHLEGLSETGMLLANALMAPDGPAESTDRFHAPLEGSHSEKHTCEDVDMVMIYELDQEVQEIDAVYHDPPVDTRSR